MHSLLLLLSLAASSSELSERCALSVYAVKPDGTLAAEATIKPDNVASVKSGGIDVSGMHLWFVKLNTDGALVNSRFTKASVGTRMAIFCGDREVSRALIAGQSTDEFMFSVSPDEP
ncbi:hypothetical protein OVA13_02685 [Pseudoxanthomonas sp. SL93]|uniref:hypothetical protein n=1 Tax=Pseudoxanthomonas sp. SL93 TaxID=2995142 RepID=UPI00226F54AA|nr:hypothetical protein [Pseudoxanthomonas sp. SL93]WAC63711.1 hypothetical protein OVA13_02660 [Pseudoxanthomonas sp. SL93]WAC63716.1 hypothetical protein OVA13_02685 [Pseudoxanthomonas sp. SL93]